MTLPDGLSRLPAYIQGALEAIWDGATADSQESMTLEFKEDPSHREGAERARPKLIEKLVDEAICMANSEVGSGIIVVGVHDKITGPKAFTGTDLREADIEQKIFNASKPNMNVSATGFLFRGTQLLAVSIPEARALYTRKDGAAKRRETDGGKFSCKPIPEETRRAIDALRRNPDYSNGETNIVPEDLRLDVVEEAHRQLVLYRRSRGEEESTMANTRTGLLRELGLLRQDGRLKRAAEILLAQPEPTHVTVRHLWRDFPGEDPKATDISAPVILALPRLRDLIDAHVQQEIARVQFDDGQEIAIPAIPGQAIDEAISNALIHRDWRISKPIVVEQSKRLLKVTSPGPLPPGVSVDRLLTVTSEPRNNRLMAAMRALGLAEESSRGFDRMWAAMIGSGREAPEVATTETAVSVIFAGANPDLEFVRGIHALSKRFGKPISAVGTLIILRHLHESPLISLQTAKVKTQQATNEARELLDSLEELGVLARLGNADDWGLSSETRELLGGTETGEALADGVQSWVQTQLEMGRTLQSAEIADRAGISTQEAGKLLRDLRDQGKAKIDPAGPPRGRGTRWIKA
ncbi:ATP-binding protein [Corynebacterium gottingense]|nr:ATP-binding protein [Corynebacterium gottingense]WJZ16496.1 Divergent AAA domain protein [Corynebacterium gottingense]